MHQHNATQLIDILHTDTQHNDTRHNGLNEKNIQLYCYAAYRYADFHLAECNFVASHGPNMVRCRLTDTMLADSLFDRRGLTDSTN
jgi:hypothetical protein